MSKLQKGPELFALIERLHGEGRTAAEAAKFLGLHVNTINDHRRLLELPRFKTAPRKVTSHAAVRLLHWEGRTAKEAAQILGVSVYTVNHHRKLLGLPIFAQPFSTHARPNAWTEADDAELEQCIDDGVRLAETAKRLGRSVGAITWRRRRLGLPGFFRPAPKPPRVWTPSRVEMLAGLVAKRVSYRLCARELGTTKNSVVGAVRDYLKEHA